MEKQNCSGNNLDSEFRYMLFPIFYSLVFVVGLAANVYVLFVLHFMREARAMNEMRIYMTNLTIADLLFICVLPLWITYYSNHGDWTYPDFLCRISGSLFFINTYCSVLFLMVISINRYWAVTQPLVAASSDCWRRGTVISIIVWVVTLGASANWLAMPGKQEVNISNEIISRCFEGYENNTYSKHIAMIHFTIIGLFFTVFSLVVFFNMLIARTLLAQPFSQPRSSTGRRPHGTKRRAVRMLCAVVGVFVVCFVPHHVVQGPWVLAVLNLTNWSKDVCQHLNDAHQVTLLLMGLNCVLDPIVYCFATRKFRKYIQDTLQRVKEGKNCFIKTNTSRWFVKARRQSEVLSVFQE
ncbi:platelet-activating factor receptor [Trichomycterus rosablanca]|uniref:platelet-activating factor receptor n=1 Tax=Trichomycterus rosablanca TaxID=2290929 RepID=UPI002F35CE8F